MSALSTARLLPRPSRPTRKQVETLVSHLHELAEAGIPSDQAMAITARSHGTPGRLAVRISKSLHGGLSLGAALARLDAPLSKAELALITAGESSGRSAQALALLLTSLSESSKLRSEVIRAAAYPALLLNLTVAVIIAMAVAVMPMLASLYASMGVELPATTRAMLQLGDLLANYGLAIVAACSLVVAAVHFANTRWPVAAQSWDRTLLRIPVVGTVVSAGERRNLYATLAALLAAGSDLEHALRLSVHTITNTQMAAAAGRLIRSVRRGVELSQALERSGLDPSGSDSALVRIAEATGDYAGALQRAAAAAAGQRRAALQRLCSLAEPLAVALMAVAVGLTVVSIYQPVLGSAALLSDGLQ